MHAVWLTPDEARQHGQGAVAGWYVFSNGAVVAGPFETRADADDWIIDTTSPPPDTSGAPSP